MTRLKIGDKIKREGRMFIIENIDVKCDRYRVREFHNRVPLDSWTWNAEGLESELSNGFAVLIRENGLKKLLEIYDETTSRRQD